MKVAGAIKAGFVTLGLLGMQLLIAASLLAIEAAPGQAPRFTYAGGTETLHAGCQGKLELSHASMTFECPEGAITIPFESITVMQYRPSVSRAIKHMKLRWKAKPSGSGGKSNLFFTVIYRENSGLHAMVLKVLPADMRPYLAQIELSTGKRIHVWDYRGFE
ncbi:MAG TPA: hypothetical protein VKV79_04890 [Terriglobia bacterium]|nr:hypothetical protein [Terriglobia bacterium]